MSADNIILIRRIDDTWWVLHTGYVDIHSDEWTPDEVDDWFRETGQQFDNVKDARKAAWDISNECIIVEHGIQHWPRECSDSTGEDQT